MENYIEDEELENEEYNYKEEAEKIKKDKKIIFYDDDFDIEDKRYFSIIPAELKEIDESEKLLSNCINKKCKYNKTLEKAKEIFINTLFFILICFPEDMTNWLCPLFLFHNKKRFFYIIIILNVSLI